MPVFNFHKFYLSVVFLVAFGLSGCSSVGERTSQLSPLVKPVSLQDTSQVKNRLQQHYADWQGTPYKYGGESRSGVDCSAYVQNAFKFALGYKLPRTTRTQINKGKKVAKTKLKVGDVVFFKISRYSLHNGVYIGDNQFIHASTSKGVTISNLNNPYWKKTYLTARRIR